MSYSGCHGKACGGGGQARCREGVEEEEKVEEGGVSLPVLRACINRGEFCKALSTSSEVK